MKGLSVTMNLRHLRNCKEPRVEKGKFASLLLHCLPTILPNSLHIVTLEYSENE